MCFTCYTVGTAEEFDRGRSLRLTGVRPGARWTRIGRPCRALRAPRRNEYRLAGGDPQALTATERWIVRLVFTLLAALACTGDLASAQGGDATKLTITGRVVYRTSRRPVAGRALWFRSLARPGDLAARPGYSASDINGTTDEEGRFRDDVSIRTETWVFGIGLGLASFLDLAGGGAADEITIEAGATGVRDLGVLVADDLEEHVPGAAGVCNAAQRPSGAPPGSVAFLVLLKRPGEFFRPWNKKEAERLQRIAPWELDSQLTARVASEWTPAPGATICIAETKTAAGEYPGVRPRWAGPLEAFRTDWDVRLVDGGGVEKTRMTEDAPGSALVAHSGASVFMKRRPDQDLRQLPKKLVEWLAKKRPTGR